MAFNHIWRELWGDGRLVDPDRDSYSRVRFNCGEGYGSEEEAIAAYHKVIESGERELPRKGLVLLKVYNP